MKDDDLPEPSRWMALRRRISTVPDSSPAEERFAETVFSVMNSQLAKPKGRFAQVAGSTLSSVKKASPHQSAKCFTEYEGPSIREASKQSKLGNPSGYIPLQVITERTGEQSTISLHIQDIENDEEVQAVSRDKNNSTETGL